MMSTETWHPSAVRVWNIAQRFQKFLVVGAVGLGVNFVMLFLLHDVAGLALRSASVAAIGLSMVVTFALNELWTWHDRGSGRVLSRMGIYVPINTIGLLINTEVLLLLVDRGVFYLVANLIGAGLAAVWNFGLNNAVTWRA
jgi:putative flippase GtrA